MKCEVKMCPNDATHAYEWVPTRSMMGDGKPILWAGCDDCVARWWAQGIGDSGPRRLIPITENGDLIDGSAPRHSTPEV